VSDSLWLCRRHVIEADRDHEAGAAVHLVKRFESAAQPGKSWCRNPVRAWQPDWYLQSLPPKRMGDFGTVPCYELAEISGLTRWRARSTQGYRLLWAAPADFVLERAAREWPRRPDVALVGPRGSGNPVSPRVCQCASSEGLAVLEAEAARSNRRSPTRAKKAASKRALRRKRHPYGSSEGAGPRMPISAGRPQFGSRSARSDPRWDDLDLCSGGASLSKRARRGRQVVSTRPTVMLLGGSALDRRSKRTR